MIQQLFQTENYGEWPDFVDDVVSGIIWMMDPFCPGPEEMWTRGQPWTSSFTNLSWFPFTKREQPTERET